MTKLLGEFLQEQQEPFSLDVYLLERGYPIKTSLDATSRFRDSTRFLKKRYSNTNCSNLVKALFGRLALHDNRKIKSSKHGGREEGEVKYTFSSYDSCSESDVEDAEFSDNGTFEGDAERKSEWRSLENSNKQLSPVSVLEETTESDEGSPLHEKQYKFKTSQGESSISIPQRKSTKNSVQKVQELVDSDSYSQYMINKRSLHQTKQLLIDCVREMIENHRKRDDKNGQHLKKILGADELWKLVCENVWLWSQDSVNETNTVKLVHCDFISFAEEWSFGCEKHKEEISMEIGDAILEGIVNEIVTSL